MSNEQLDLALEVPDKPVFSIEPITPAMASVMLRFNTKNRKVNEKLVDEQVRQILSGEFLFNGETVKLSWGVEIIGPDGKPMTDEQGNVIKVPILLDGQHRLRAIEKAGETNPDLVVEILVVRGLDPKTQPTIDTGRKRTTADSLRIEGEKESTNLGALLSGAWKWDSGDRMFSTNPKPTPIECQKLLEENEERVRRALDVGLQAGRGFIDLSKSSLAISHYILSALDQEHVPYFFRLIETGFNLVEGHPVAALRKRASSYRRTGQPMTTRRQVGLVIRAWNKCVLDETVGSLAQEASARVEEPLNPMGRYIPMLAAAEFKSDEH